MWRWAGRRSANPPGASTELPAWMPGARAPSWKRQHRLKSPGLARRAQRVEAPHRARQPRVEHDPLPGLDAGVGPRVLHGGDHLVAEHLGERDERGHRRVGRALEVHEDLLDVAAADAGHAGAQHRPLGPADLGLGHLLQRHRRDRQVAHEAGARRPAGPGGRRGRRRRCHRRRGRTCTSSPSREGRTSARRLALGSGSSPPLCHRRECIRAPCSFLTRVSCCAATGRRATSERGDGRRRHRHDVGQGGGGRRRRHRAGPGPGSP